MYLGNGTTTLSSNYRTEMSKTTRFPTTLTCTIDFTTGVTRYNYIFRNENILESSFKIDNSIENSYGLALGSVYTGRCTFTVKDCTSTRYINGEPQTPKEHDKITSVMQRHWKGQFLYARLHQYYNKEQTGTYDDIELGTWIITNVERAGKYFTITAYDITTRLDKKIKDSNFTPNDYSPANLINLACQSCSLTAAQTYTVINALTPKYASYSGDEYLGTSDITITITKEDVEALGSWRNLLSKVATLLGGFFYINRQGALEFRKLGTDEFTYNYRKYYSSNEIKISKEMLRSLNYSDIPNDYTSLIYKSCGVEYSDFLSPSSTSSSILRLSTADKEIVRRDGVVIKSYVSGEHSVRLINMDSFDVKLKYTYYYRDSSGTRRSEVRYDGADVVVKYLAEQRFIEDGFYETYSGDFEYILGDPTIDLGDIISVDIREGEGEDDGTEPIYKKFLVTSYTWTYHGGHKIKSIGMNSNLYYGSTEIQENKTAINTMDTVYEKMEPVMETNSQTFGNISATTTVITVPVPTNIKNGTGKIAILGNVTVNAPTNIEQYTLVLKLDNKNVYNQQLKGGESIVNFNRFVDSSELSTNLTLLASASISNVSINANDAQLIILPYMR